ncbi:MAG: hypothetical protein ISS48_04035 [Candidatus Aenigmarchaeota archaeon]|nr:hypothetical protein [Candidatus Aenigmarchaeota archaeon]
MKTFENRLKLQKFVYLLQFLRDFKLNIGYDFEFYLYGPYSTELTSDGFQIKDFNKTPSVKFVNEDSEKKFTKFLKFFDKHKNEPNWLEYASSIHYLKQLNPKETKGKIVDKVSKKRPDLQEKKNEIEIVWDEISKSDFI